MVPQPQQDRHERWRPTIFLIITTIVIILIFIDSTALIAAVGG
jgi:hypothetical protein